MIKNLPSPKNRCWDGNGGEIDSTEGLIKMCTEHIDKSMIGVEVGSFMGRSSEVIAFFCKELTCVDPWETACEIENYGEISKERLIMAEGVFDEMNSRTNNIKKRKGFSLNCVKDFEDSTLDFVYIDGRHDYDSVMKDIVSWSKKVKDGGIISGHDFHLVNSVLKEIGVIAKSYSDSSWVYYKSTISLI
jgi:predicted O-methyltransferase YrrM